MSTPEGRVWGGLHPWLWCLICGVLAAVAWYICHHVFDTPLVATSVAVGFAVFFTKIGYP